jgi:hypothetical protein
MVLVAAIAEDSPQLLHLSTVHLYSVRQRLEATGCTPRDRHHIPAARRGEAKTVRERRNAPCSGREAPEGRRSASPETAEKLIPS